MLKQCTALGRRHGMPSTVVYSQTSGGIAMTAAIIGLIGAVVGAVTAVIGSTVSDRRQARREELRWRRDRQGAAYDGALRHLLRAANWRSGLSLRGGAVTAYLKEENIADWFDDLVEAQFWLRTLAGRCGPAQVVPITQAADRLDESISSIGSGAKPPSARVLLDAAKTVTVCARLDMGPNAPVGSARWHRTDPPEARNNV